jgi:hypothetical protein
MDLQERVASLLKNCGTELGILPPTALFNEGWMLRLVLDWAASHPDAIESLPFMPGSRWYSEAWLPSRFKPRRRGDPGGEGYTHADGVIGHFQLRAGGRGDIELLPGACQFTVVEAKMASGLSAGTTRAPDFNQAARNIACMAHLVSESGIDLAQMVKLSFVLVAPAERIDDRVRAVLAKSAIKASVQKRSAEFDQSAVDWCESDFDRVFGLCSISPVSWEQILQAIQEVDAGSGASFRAFYEKCRQFNPIRVTSHQRES